MTSFQAFGTGGLSVQAVLFDRDNTLAVTDTEVYKEAACWLAAQHQLDPAHVGQTLAQQWQEQKHAWLALRTPQDEDLFWQNYSLELMNKLQLPHAFAADIMRHYPYEVYLKPVAGAREVLTKLRALGLKIGVLSNTLPSIERTLEAIDLADLVHVPLASCALGVHKPERAAFELAAQALGFEPQHILFIDDLEENVEAAQQIGMQAKLIDLAGHNPKAIHGLHAVLDLVNAG